MTPSGQPLQTYTTSEAGGSWSVQGDTLPDGVYTVRAEQDDAAGNLGLSAATFTVGTSYRDDVLSDNPAGYWRLGESSGTVAASELERRPTAPTRTAFSSARRADSPATRTPPPASTGSTTSSPFLERLNATTGVTIEAWVKRSKTGAWQNILGKPGNGGNAARTTPSG